MTFQGYTDQPCPSGIQIHTSTGLSQSHQTEARPLKSATLTTWPQHQDELISI